MMKVKYLHYYLSTNKKRPPLENLPTLDSLKKAYILYLLRLTAHDIIETSEILNIPPERLKEKIRQYNLTDKIFLYH